MSSWKSPSPVRHHQARDTTPIETLVRRLLPFGCVRRARKLLLHIPEGQTSTGGNGCHTTQEAPARDLKGLDALLTFYRSKKDVSSTTQVQLTVEYYEGARKIRVERLHDSSGGWGLEERPEVLTLWELTQRFEKAGE